MRPVSLITLSSLISSAIAAKFFSTLDVHVEETAYNVGCGSDVYSVNELIQATTRGCELLMNRNDCPGIGNCLFSNKRLGIKLYTGTGFEKHDKDVYVSGLPRREGSHYVSGVLFDLDPDYRYCKTLGALYRVKHGDVIRHCVKFQLQSEHNSPKSPSPRRQGEESHSRPQQRPESHSSPQHSPESHYSPPTFRKSPASSRSSGKF